MHSSLIINYDIINRQSNSFHCSLKTHEGILKLRFKVDKQHRRMSNWRKIRIRLNLFRFAEILESGSCFPREEGIGNRLGGFEKGTPETHVSVIAGDTAAEAADRAGRAAAEDSAQPHVPVHRQGEGIAGATGRFALVPPYHHLHKCAKSSKLIFCICSIPTEDHHQDIPRSLLDGPPRHFRFSGGRTSALAGSSSFYTREFLCACTFREK